MSKGSHNNYNRFSNVEIAIHLKFRIIGISLLYSSLMRDNVNYTPVI